jgi:translocation protein SEC62
VHYLWRNYSVSILEIWPTSQTHLKRVGTPTNVVKCTTFILAAIMAEQQSPQSPQGPQVRLQPGQQPTPDQIAAMQKQLEIDAKKNGMTVPQFIAKLKEQALVQQQQQQQAAQRQQGQAQQQGQQPITPGPPNPAAIAVANFLKGQDLKMRTCILNGQRKDMFKGKFFL